MLSPISNFLYACKDRVVSRLLDERMVPGGTVLFLGKSPLPRNNNKEITFELQAQLARQALSAVFSFYVVYADQMIRSQFRRDDPLNLSISVSGGEETNKDSLSNGERSGKSPS